MTGKVRVKFDKWVYETILKVMFSGSEMMDEDINNIANNMDIPGNRILYEFFDVNGIKLGIVPNGDKFNYIIDLQYSELFDSRREAEIKGFNKCEELLEEKL